MNRFNPHSVGRTATLLLSVSAGAVVLLFLLFPERIFAASINGLDIWWKIVFPVLLPFLILTEILTAFGAVHWIGCWLRPATRWMFRLPESGGWALASGLTGGYPSGAEATAALRKQGLVEREQGERLLALTHTCSPVVVVSVMAVGFFDQPELGLYLLAAHWFSLILLGWVLSIVWHQGPRGPVLPPVKSDCRTALANARMRDGRGLGQILGDAVTVSITRLMHIGGWMMIFAVVSEVLRITGIMQALAKTASVTVGPLMPGAPEGAWEAFMTGIFEVHLGVFSLGQLYGNQPSLALIALTGAVIAWSGWSLMFQVQHLLRETDLRWTRFLFARFLHGLLVIVVTPLLWPWFRERLSESKFVFAPSGGAVDEAGPWNAWIDLPLWAQPLLALAAVTAALTAAAAIMRLSPQRSR